MTSRGTRGTTLALAVLLAAGVVACGSSTDPAAGGTTPAGAPAAAATVAGSEGAALQGAVLVAAAASLTDAFAAVEAAFEHDHPRVDVVLNLAGSSSLREQVLEGAPADVFAPANTASMDRVVAAGAATDPTVVATNRLQIAVPAGNPAGITGLEQFADQHLLLGLCAVGVPCGDLAREALDRAGVAPAVDTSEPHVRALLTKVEAGELDAGVTYVTDVAATDGAVDGVDLPDAAAVVAEYPVAVLTDAPNPAAAEAFVAFLLAGPGQRILAEHGFGPP